MKAHIFKDHFLNKIIEPKTTGRTTPYHDNGIGPHLKSFDEIPQDDFKRKTDTLIGMEDAQGQGFSAGLRRKNIRDAGSLCDRFAEDMHRAQMRKGYFHPCLPTTFFLFGRGWLFRLSVLSFQVTSAISP
jgi:hypothetical protein